MARRTTKRRFEAVHQASAKRRWGDKKTSVEVDDPIGILLGNAIDSIYPGIIESITQAAKEIYDFAYENWPVRSGFSKKNLEWGIEMSQTHVRSFVISKANYTKYIHEPFLKDKIYIWYLHGPKTKIWIWQELLIKPQKLKARELTKELANKIPDDLIPEKFRKAA